MDTKIGQKIKEIKDGVFWAKYVVVSYRDSRSRGFLFSWCSARLYQPSRQENLGDQISQKN